MPARPVLRRAGQIKLSGADRQNAYSQSGKITTCIRTRVGEVCVMNAVQQTVSNTSGAGSVVHLTVKADDVKVMAEDPEQLMEEMWLRATHAKKDILKK